MLSQGKTPRGDDGEEKAQRSDAYKRNETDDPTTPDQQTSSDAYKRNSTHDPTAEGHVKSSDAYERDSKLPTRSSEEEE